TRRGRTASSATAARPTNSPATGLVAAARNAPAAPPASRTGRDRPVRASSPSRPNATPSAYVTRPETRLPAKQNAPSRAPGSGRGTPVRTSSAASATDDTTSASAPVGRGPSSAITHGETNEYPYWTVPPYQRRSTAANPYSRTKSARATCADRSVPSGGASR